MITLRKTCGARPEQYDAYLNGLQVGYLRLRHGHFSVECPDSGGTLVYEACPHGDGVFASEERDYHLRFAVDAIQRWLENPGFEVEKPPAPDVEYEVA